MCTGDYDRSTVDHLPSPVNRPCLELHDLKWPLGCTNVGVTPNKGFEVQRYGLAYKTVPLDFRPHYIGMILKWEMRGRGQKIKSKSSTKKFG